MQHQTKERRTGSESKGGGTEKCTGSDKLTFSIPPLQKKINNYNNVTYISLSSQVLPVLPLPYWVTTGCMSSVWLDFSSLV